MSQTSINCYRDNRDHHASGSIKILHPSKVFKSLFLSARVARHSRPLRPSLMKLYLVLNITLTSHHHCNDCLQLQHYAQELQPLLAIMAIVLCVRIQLTFCMAPSLLWTMCISMANILQTQVWPVSMSAFSWPTTSIHCPDHGLLASIGSSYQRVHVHHTSSANTLFHCRHCLI